MKSGSKRWVARGAFGFAALLVAQASLLAAELLVFERPGCAYCAAFDREVAPIYPLTREGKAIPARRVDITRPIPADLDFIKVERFTPVFVLVDNRLEIGRIRGYSGDDHFWGLLGVLVARLEEQAQPVAGSSDTASVDSTADAHVER